MCKTTTVNLSKLTRNVYLYCFLYTYTISQFTYTRVCLGSGESANTVSDVAGTKLL